MIRRPPSPSPGSSPSPSRPTTQERENAIEQAKRDAQSDNWDPVDIWRLNRHLAKLKIFGEREIVAALLVALGEIGANDYRGPFPPETSYEDACRGAELFAFAWNSRHFGCPMYLKFCFFEKRMLLVSFHIQK